MLHQYCGYQVDIVQTNLFPHGVVHRNYPGTMLGQDCIISLKKDNIKQAYIIDMHRSLMKKLKEFEFLLIWL